MKPLLIFAALCAAVPAAAAERAVAVRRGVESGVGTFVRFYTSNCLSAGVASVRILRQPTHGVARIRPYAAAAGSDAACAGTMVKGVAFYYRPSRGYVGPDEFIVSIPSPGDDVRSIADDTVTYRLIVR